LRVPGIVGVDHHAQGIGPVGCLDQGSDVVDLPGRLPVALALLEDPQPGDVEQGTHPAVGAGLVGQPKGARLFA